ncbi:hypothetical protein MKEN_01367500 [Mycena kentingensis (nom. inval.)]|nr:hypothetical protein MKEN_01367500 [Mycena kentingensis (nom. inval.)]
MSYGGDTRALDESNYFPVPRLSSNGIVLSLAQEGSISWLFSWIQPTIAVPGAQGRLNVLGLPGPDIGRSFGFSCRLQIMQVAFARVWVGQMGSQARDAVLLSILTRVTCTRSITMPKSEAHVLRSTSLLRFGNLAPEIIFRVLRLCHPMDLVQLANTSRAFLNLLPDDSTLWRSAQLNLAVGVCPPLPRNPPMAARGNYSSSAYVRWIFGGGKCSACSRKTHRALFDFALNLRACSRNCEKCIHSQILVSFPDDHPIHSAPWRSLLDSRVYRRPSGQQVLVFKQSQVTAIEAEWGRAEAAGDSSLAFDSAGVVPARSISELQAVCQRRQATALDREEVFCTVMDVFISLTVTQNAHQLARWNIAYQKQKALVVQKNTSRLKSITRAENVRFALLVDTKTVRKLLDVFNRDLEEVTPLVWNEYRVAALAEVDHACWRTDGVGRVALVPGLDGAPSLPTGRVIGMATHRCPPETASGLSTAVRGSAVGSFSVPLPAALIVLRNSCPPNDHS